MTVQNFYSSFHEAATDVLKHLHDRLGFNLWMVTRAAGNDWIVLEAVDHGYGVKQGDVFKWAHSFCSRMVEGKGPRIAPCSADVPAYANAPIGRQVPIGAYVGVPLSCDDNQLFGTMCAIHPEPRPAWITDELRTVELYARLLSSLLQAELKTAEEARGAERARAEAMTDQLTGLYNRRGWQELIKAEESRCRRYGHPACLVSIDIDYLKIANDTQGHAAGDSLLCRAAHAIREPVRVSDLAARLGGDEFAVLAVECDEQNAQFLMHRLRQAFLAHNVHASLGLAICSPADTFEAVWNAADMAMYEEKRQRGSCRSAPPLTISESLALNGSPLIQFHI
jgi:diguanylate cyclase (GGDEF)-like protein